MKLTKKVVVEIVSLSDKFLENDCVTKNQHKENPIKFFRRLMFQMIENFEID